MFTSTSLIILSSQRPESFSTGDRIGTATIGTDKGTHSRGLVPSGLDTLHDCYYGRIPSISLIVSEEALRQVLAINISDPVQSFKDLSEDISSLVKAMSLAGGSNSSPDEPALGCYAS